MPRNGLTKEIVVNAAIELIKEKGSQAFTMNELARRLDIKPASLYNHIQSIDELTDEAGSRIAAMLRSAELNAIEGKNRDEALRALCSAYRLFAINNSELYKVNIGRQLVGRDFEKAEKGEIVDPMMKLLSEYDLDDNQKMHWHRILRALLHGFVSQEFAGRFHGFSVACDRTFQKAVDMVILGIHFNEKRSDNE